MFDSFFDFFLSKIAFLYKLSFNLFATNMPDFAMHKKKKLCNLEKEQHNVFRKFLLE